jgi:phage I-like protein
MSLEEQAEVIAKHNKSDEMVSKINEYCSLDEEGRQAMIAEFKSKFSHMKNKFADMTPEEREAKFAQFKEMKQAFSSISDEDREIIKSHFKEMKAEYANLSDEEKDAKHVEFKSKMEEFSALTLDEKIIHLQELANSLRQNLD